jgi:hypothetical protein
MHNHFQDNTITPVVPHSHLVFHAHVFKHNWQLFTFDEPLSTVARLALFGTAFGLVAADRSTAVELSVGFNVFE